MSEQFYIRIRGVEQGPYDEAQLQLLVRRGQLARIHEISRDRKQWETAEDYPHLFVSVVPVRSMGPEQVSQIDSGPLTLRQAGTDTVHDGQADTGTYHAPNYVQPAYDSGAAYADDGAEEESGYATGRRRRRPSSSKSPLDAILQLIVILMILAVLGGVAYKVLN